MDDRALDANAAAPAPMATPLAAVDDPGADPALAPDPAPAVDPHPGETSAPAQAPLPTPSDDGDLSLLALIDRLSDLLGRSDLTELEVEAGSTGLVLRKPSALAPAVVVGAGVVGGAGSSGAQAAAGAVGPDGVAGPASAAVAPAPRPSVKAPLTGIFYTSPSPGAPAYVHVGGEVAVGQVIGLIEAMKLFNEIKSDLAGRVVRIAADNGALVKAKQPLIEVEPL